MPTLKSKLKTLTPARIKMAKETIRNVKAAIPKKQQKAMTKGAKKLVAGLKKVIR